MLYSHKNYPHALPALLFTNHVKETMHELNQIGDFLERASMEPMLLFTESYRVLKTANNLLVNSFQTEDRKDGLTPHAFLIFLGSLLDKAFTEWATTQQLSFQPSVKVRQPNTFPSIFAIYVEDTELMQFNIFEQWYGIQQNILTPEEIKSNLKRKEASINNMIEDLDKKIEKCQSFQKSPLSKVRSLKDTHYYLFKRKALLEKVAKKIDRFEDLKIALVKELQEERNKIQEHLEFHADKQEKLNGILPFFKELGYALQDEKYKLY
ncbi:hypothetical protein PP175_28725 (plasmid) [Aneurinibacillus sp. Ricciae_BoGa-3]|uniref:hypothetical protein n=1 Tax=Aneurinibacillus sp. Ricciae_BoGa-3 TaxID=3022697 RepID=UPI002341CA45|nr:hypothetical protein [Aneurinibacillus sp. Ricciae_BoGa-3]WCK57175.1 hypothetical protein PP175_28725 [Aneurinibacillus sp. Ricciae_BoGa-3]